ncbi:MAG TPA: hypothetical protein VK718_02310 [Ferruginibacter sp.]|nr:hypothetical protein [Ferruginibacter sp.]
MSHKQYIGKMPTRYEEDEQVVNEEEQDIPINPQDDEGAEDKEKGYEEGNRDDSDTEDESELPGQHDDSGKTIQETPHMEYV